MVNQSLRKVAYAIAASALGSCLLAGCVDNDYDLSKDMDLNVTLGGSELNLPVSSTATLTMKDILDLDEDDSSIREATEGEYGLHAGDYVLVQAPENTPEPSTVKIAEVELNDFGNPSHATEKLKMHGSIPGLWELEGPLKTTLEIKDDHIDPSIQSINWGETHISLKVVLNYSSDNNSYNGELELIGENHSSVGDATKIIFDENWELAISDSHTAGYLRVNPDKKNEIILARDMPFTYPGQTETLVIDVTKIKFKENPAEGEGLYAPGNPTENKDGKFDLNADVNFEAYAAIYNTTIPTSDVVINLDAMTQVTEATIKRVEGTVKPDIDIDPTTVNINDIPDFLSDNENNLDILNPMIKFDVTNTSPVRAEVSAVIEATYPAESGKAPVAIGIGSKYDRHNLNGYNPNLDAKNPIIIEGDRQTHLCLTQTGEVEDEYTPVLLEANELTKLLQTIPERIEIKDIEVDAIQEPVVFQLGDGANYTFATDYEAVVPFTFGPDMKLVYSTTEMFEEEDLDSYNFDEVHISMDVVNGTPLGMTPDIIALDSNGNKIENITCTFYRDNDADIMIEANTTTPLKAVLKSIGSNIGNLGGVEIVFTAITGQEGASQTLNANQSLRLDNIQVSITGGITVDINDL